MCIIVAVPRNADMPTIETMKECFRSNPDGAGFMYADGKRVRIRKGFMTFESFIDALDAEEIPDGSALVMHFRITTSGKTQPKCCHPFPVSSSKEDLQALSTDSRWGVAHNGVISGRTTYDGWSDTMDFIAEVVAPLARMNPSFMHSDDALELLQGACMSKLAILDNAGDLALVGEFIEDNGVFYSNKSYLPVVYNWSSYNDWWAKSFDAKTEYAEWDDLDELMDALPHVACQECPMAEDCARYGADYGYECGSEFEALQTCADFTGENILELAEVLGLDLNEVASAAWEGR